MEEKNLTIYDATAEYEDKIYPLLNEIKKYCKIHKIPFVFACAVKNDEKKTDYKYEAVLTGADDIVLCDDKFEQFLAALAGFKLVPLPALSTSYEEDDGMLTDMLSDDVLDYIEDIDNEDTIVTTITPSQPLQVTETATSDAPVEETSSAPSEPVAPVAKDKPKRRRKEKSDLIDIGDI